MTHILMSNYEYWKDWSKGVPRTGWLRAVSVTKAFCGLKDPVSSYNLSHWLASVSSPSIKGQIETLAAHEAICPECIAEIEKIGKT